VSVSEADDDHLSQVQELRTLVRPTCARYGHNIVLDDRQNNDKKKRSAIRSAPADAAACGRFDRDVPLIIFTTNLKR
jgi:hypothetical protein